MTAKQKLPLNQIYFYLTDGCNLRCRHCSIAPEYQTEGKAAAALDLELFRHIVDQAKPLGLSSVKLSGGEPLIHPQISEILDYLWGQDLRLSIETNGIDCWPRWPRRTQGLQRRLCFGELGRL